MYRLLKGALAGAMVLALGFGTMGCQGESGSNTSTEKGKADAKKAGEEMKKIMEKRPKAGGGAAGGGAEDEDKDKDKDKGGDKK
jgi:hypothetical protein